MDLIECILDFPTHNKIGMKSLTKTLKGFKLEKGFLPPEIRVEEEINDVPRKVTEFHYCRSRPQNRGKVHVAGLSKSIL